MGLAWPGSRLQAGPITALLLIETDRRENLNHLLLGGEKALIGQDKWEDRGIFFRAVDVVLDVECASWFAGESVVVREAVHGDEGYRS